MKSNLQILIELCKNYIGYISIREYKNIQGEISNYKINLGFSYEKAKKKDLVLLNEGVEYIESERYTRVDWDNAIAELMRSLSTPTKINENVIKLGNNNNLHYHIESTNVYILGILDEKKVLQPIEYKKKNSNPKTIAKNAIKSKYLRTGKIRMFIFDYEKLTSIKLNGETLDMS